MLSDLPTELSEEVLSRVPMIHMKAVRCVCKNWNTLSKNRSVLKKRLAKALAAREFTVVVVAGFRASLMSVNLHGIYEGVDPSLNLQGKLVSLTDSDSVKIYQIHHCDGLLLCTLMNDGDGRVVVWNPYLGQIRVFEPMKHAPNTHHSGYDHIFSIGYKNSKSYRSYKILRFEEVSKQHLRYELYYINPQSCTDITVPITIRTDWVVKALAIGASVKGNTYWYAQDQKVKDVVFLICFDFTTDRFGPRLSLPFHSYIEDTVTLSSVRDEQLAVLFQNQETYEIEIWITTKIEPKVASWSKVFLEVGMNPSTPVPFLWEAGSFFVDEEKKVAVVFTDIRGEATATFLRKVAFIIGEDGYIKEVDFGEVVNMNSYFSCPIMCSYAPSLAGIIPPARGVKRKKTKLLRLYGIGSCKRNSYHLYR